MSDPSAKARKSGYDRIRFFSSSMEAFLQDFIEKTDDDDRLGSVVAAARIAQLGSVIEDEFSNLVSALAESKTEMKAAQQACNLVVTLVNKNAALTLGEPEGSAPEQPDSEDSPKTGGPNRALS